MNRSRSANGPVAGMAPVLAATPARAARAGFTLVELLVVIAIIATLIGILLPSLNKARQTARTTTCLSQLHQISLGLLTYATDNHGLICPAYNLPPATPTAATNFTGSASQPLDGWACILDRDGYLRGSQSQASAGIFYCPDTVDAAGLAGGATGTNGAAQRGWVDWPMVFLGGGDTAPKQALTIPASGFNRILRVGYWINAYHPTGQSLTAAQIATKDLYYSTVVGYGPDAPSRIAAHKVGKCRNTSRTITVADGVFMGRQSADGLGMTNSVIGYRHRGPAGPLTAANAGFADGHAQTLARGHFPLAYGTTAGYAAAGGTDTFAGQQAQNIGGATVYTDPQAALQLFLAANPGAD